MLEELLFGGSHKYVAPQFALLYRALAFTGLALQPHKIKVGTTISLLTVKFNDCIQFEKDKLTINLCLFNS